MLTRIVEKTSNFDYNTYESKIHTESNDMIILTLNSLSKNFLRLNIVIRVIIDLGLKQMENSSVSYCL